MSDPVSDPVSDAVPGLDGPTLTHDRAAGRFEIGIGGTRAGFASYRRSGDRYVVTHTEIAPELGGRGLASTLIRFALDEIRGDGAAVVPECPFVVTYLRRHPDDVALVPEADRARFGLGAG